MYDINIYPQNFIDILRYIYCKS